MAKRACYRAPTKVILLGEHFVVKGVPGVSAAIGLYAYACVEESEGPLVIEAVDYGLDCRVCDGCDCPPRLEGLARIASILGISGFRVRVWSEAPPGRGLGSSAAVSVALAAALLDALEGRVDPDEVERLAWEAERVHHGKPSGIDHTTSIMGGYIVFHARGVYERLDACRVKLVVADTGVERSTREAVERVLGRYHRLGATARMLYNAAWLAVEEGIAALRECNVEKLGEIMDYAHGLLYAMGASSESIERLVWAARRAGAYGSKLTGAGIGGVIIALVDSSTAESVAKSLRDAGSMWVRIVDAGVAGFERFNAEEQLKSRGGRGEGGR